MTTEEKNTRNTAAELLAENETKNIVGPVAKDVTASMIKRYFNKGWDARDKEVSDLVEALREARKDHIEHRTLSEGVALDSSYAQGVIAHNEFVDDLDELLSKYPVNKAEECDHDYVPIGEYNQNGAFVCTKCKDRI